MNDDIAYWRTRSLAAVTRRARAIPWLREAGNGLSLAWLETGDGRASPAAGRAEQALALRVALAALHDEGRAPDPARCTLAHTRLGAPLVRVRGGPPALRPRVSLCHEGGAHVALAGCAPGLVGVGIDAVRLDRLRRRDAAHLRRLAERFLPPAGCEALEWEARAGGPEALLAGVAARFALVEAASKALGTGLRLGLGLGARGGLPPPEMGVVEWRGAVRLEPGAAARRRMAALGAARIGGHAGCDAEYAVGVVLLHGAPGETARARRP